MFLKNPFKFYLFLLLITLSSRIGFTLALSDRFSSIFFENLLSKCARCSLYVSSCLFFLFKFFFFSILSYLKSLKALEWYLKKAWSFSSIHYISLTMTFSYFLFHYSYIYILVNSTFAFKSRIFYSELILLLTHVLTVSLEI